MTSGWRWLGLALLAAHLGWPHAVAGQLLRIDQIASQVGFGFDGVWAEAGPAETGTRFYEEWAQARFAGSVLDPRIVSFDIGLNPTWRQRQLSEVAGPAISGRGNQLNFIASMNALSAGPVMLALNGSRFSGTELDPYGVRRDGTESILGVAASYPDPYFKLTRLSLERRALDATRQQFGVIAREQASSQSIARLTAENSKTRVLLERRSVDDRLFGRDFTTSQALLHHRLGWGKGSRVQSFFTYLDRDRISTLNWSQATHLQHTYSLSSDYGYQLLAGHGRDAANHGWRWDAAARYRPVARLNFGLEGYGRANDFEVSREQWHEARTHLDFSLGLPLGAELLVGASLGHTWFERTTSGLQFVRVLAEQHVIDSSRRFALDNLFADPGTITISNRSGSLLFDAGFDFSLVSHGAEIEVLVLPGGRITLGDTLFVDYSFQTNPAGTDDFRTVTLGGTLRISAVTVAHQQTRRGNAGGDSVGLDLTRSLRYESRTSVDVNLRTGIAFFRLSGQRLRTENAFIHATDYLLHGGLDFAAGTGLSGGLFFDSTVREDDVRPFELMSGTATLRWAVSRSLQLNGRAGAWTLSRRDDPRQRSLTGGIGAELLFRALTLRTRYDHMAFSQRVDRIQNAASFDIVRRF